MLARQEQHLLDAAAGFRVLELQHDLRERKVCVLDGLAIVLSVVAILDDDHAAADRNVPAVFYCFDLLYFAGIDLRTAPYCDRRRYIAQCLLPTPLVQLVHASEDGIAMHKA
ncbi:MAG: DNA ligase D, partial [Acidimicrobiia bacterium]